MHILMSTHHHLDQNTGAQGSTLKLAEEYRRLGHSAEVFSLDDLPRRIPYKVKLAVFAEYLYKEARARSRKGRLDVLDASQGDGWLCVTPPFKLDALLVARSVGLYHLDHLATLEEVKQGNLKLSWRYPIFHGGLRLKEEARAFRGSDIAFFLNRLERDFAVQKLRIDAAKATVVRNGLPERFFDLPFTPTPSADEPLHIVQLGSFVSRKGVAYSVPAFNALLKRHPRLHVWFIGAALPGQVEDGRDTSERDITAQFSEEVRARVKVVPSYQLEDLPKLLVGKHIKLFSTLSEGFGKVLIEAMACGLAPVTTSTPGPLEIVTPGEDALVIPPRDTPAIEQALETLLRDRDHLDRLRRAGYARAQDFSWSEAAQARLRAYEAGLCAKRGVAGERVES